MTSPTIKIFERRWRKVNEVTQKFEKIKSKEKDIENMYQDELEYWK